MNKNNKVSVSDSILVGAGKSSRLAAIRKKQFQTKENKHIQQPVITDLKPEVQTALQRACVLIEERMAFIMKGYPSNKKNTFFKLRYGIDFVKINEMPLKNVFDLLNLQAETIRQFHLIKDLDSNGKVVSLLEDD